MFRTLLTFKQTDMMKHAWGYHTKNPGFRAHYCTELDNEDMLHMVAEGYFREPVGEHLVGKGFGIFHLTDKGIKQLEKFKGMEKEAKP